MVHHIQFVDSFADLPSTAPANHPHIIDLTTFKENDGEVITDIKIQDAIVTTLHQVSKKTLTKFFHPTKAFHMDFESKTDRYYNRIIVKKKGNEVLVGQYAKVQDWLEFDNLLRCSIDATGAWKITYAAYRDYFSVEMIGFFMWENVWAGNRVNVGGHLAALRFETTEGQPERAMLATQVADHLLAGQYWDSNRWTREFHWGE